MVDAEAAIAAELKKLRNTYLDRLPTEIGELKILAENLTGCEAERAKLEELF